MIFYIFAWFVASKQYQKKNQKQLIINKINFSNHWLEKLAKQNFW